jgi:hypothetical protein
VHLIARAKSFSTLLEFILERPPHFFLYKKQWGIFIAVLLKIISPPFVIKDYKSVR